LQTNQIFINHNGKFTDRSDVLLSGIQLKQASRGLLSGDLDNDGDIDFIFTNNNQQPQVLINKSNNRQTTINNWLGIDLSKNSSNLTAIGARVVLTLKDGTEVTRIVHRDGSYASSKDPRIIFGLGQSNKAVIIDIYWLNGTHQRYTELTLNQYHNLVRSKGKNINEK